MIMSLPDHWAGKHTLVLNVENIFNYSFIFSNIWEQNMF